MCSSEHVDGGRGQAHREVINTVAEMKKRLPSDKRSRSKASTVEALNYALHCVKQVQGTQLDTFLTLIHCIVQRIRVPDVDGVVLQQCVCLRCPL